MSFSLFLSFRILDISTAAKASYGWNCFLRECSEVDFPTDIWFLHVAAIESKLRVHAGKHILSTTPEVKKVHGTSKDLLLYLKYMWMKGYNM